MFQEGTLCARKIKKKTTHRKKFLKFRKWNSVALKNLIKLF